MKNLKDTLINESSININSIDEYEFILNGLENIYNGKNWDNSSIKTLKNLYNKIWKEDIKIDKEYFENSSFGQGDINKIDR